MYFRLFFLFVSILVASYAWPKCQKLTFNDRFYNGPGGPILLNASYSLTIDFETTNQTIFTISDVSSTSANSSYQISWFDLSGVNVYPENMTDEEPQLICNYTENFVNGQCVINFREKHFGAEWWFGMGQTDNFMAQFQLMYDVNEYKGLIVKNEGTLLTVESPNLDIIGTSSYHTGLGYCSKFEEVSVPGFSDRCNKFASYIKMDDSTTITIQFDYSNPSVITITMPPKPDKYSQYDFSMATALGPDNYNFNGDLRDHVYNFTLDLTSKNFVNAFVLSCANCPFTYLGAYGFIGTIMSLDGAMLKEETKPYTQQDSCSNFTTHFDSLSGSWTTSTCCVSWEPRTTLSPVTTTSTCKAEGLSCDKGKDCCSPYICFNRVCT